MTKPPQIESIKIGDTAPAVNTTIPLSETTYKSDNNTMMLLMLMMMSGGLGGGSQDSTNTMLMVLLMSDAFKSKS
jgi:hypothetical protein